MNSRRHLQGQDPVAACRPCRLASIALPPKKFEFRFADFSLVKRADWWRFTPRAGELVLRRLQWILGAGSCTRHNSFSPRACPRFLPSARLLSAHYPDRWPGNPQGVPLRCGNSLCVHRCPVPQRRALVRGALVREAPAYRKYGRPVERGAHEDEPNM